MKAQPEENIYHKEMDIILSEFKKANIYNPRQKIKNSDCLGALFSLFENKYASLLNFDKSRRIENTEANLKTLYEISWIPSDTHMRTRLDDGRFTDCINYTRTKLFENARYAGVLNNWRILDNKYAINLDLEITFKSQKIHCHLCVENISRGKKKYVHEIVNGMMINPKSNVNLPMGHEKVAKIDHHSANYRLETCIRWAKEFRALNGDLPVVITGDEYLCNKKFIKNLKEQECSYIIKVDKKNSYLNKYFENNENYESVRCIKNIPMEEGDEELVNLYFWEEVVDNEKQRFMYISDLEVNKFEEGIFKSTAKLRIPKTDDGSNEREEMGYNFRHDFGHGSGELSQVVTSMMFMCYLLDQIRIIAHEFFRKLLEKFNIYKNLYEQVKQQFRKNIIDNLEKLFKEILEDPSS